MSLPPLNLHSDPDGPVSVEVRDVRTDPDRASESDVAVIEIGRALAQLDWRDILAVHAYLGSIIGSSRAQGLDR